MSTSGHHGSSWVRGLGFGDWGSGIGALVLGLGIGVWGLVFGVWGFNKENRTPQKRGVRYIKTNTNTCLELVESQATRRRRARLKANDTQAIGQRRSRLTQNKRTHAADRSEASGSPRQADIS
ncbi:hypothetical protein KGM_201857 [Danaus plexippus plexippus]|uniref:Uncharacterized protein n=1 Tax=Danaus plexippus plexippus TaxID=278856 RepID=A0A212EGU7_DANPL|nr:hypothetical protein KGM_201857 [Danaus plexippus plexippus]